MLRLEGSRIRLLGLGTGLTLVLALVSEARGGDGVAIRYGRDIRPILSDKCFACHGADPATRAADLRLDVRAEAVRDRGGYRAIEPGDVETSELWYRVAHEDPELRMPPLEAKKPALSAEELERIARWIADGAEYEEHWSFVAPERPALPVVDDAAWPLNPIDHFVLERLERAGVAPSPEADRATLLRRVHFDLTGLPPTLAELDAFLGDEGADAYERAVARLFAGEATRTRIAEHLATPWLDAARYADTIGIHTDAGRQLWPYRDWVLRALRDNLPYDEFVTRQLAGDLLPDATLDDRVATGFQRCHVVTDEGGALDEEYLVEYAVERASTLGTTLLGLTVGCARCHDHKYDPLTQTDFYGLYAFFRSNDEPGLYSQETDPERAFEPALAVPSRAQAAALAGLDAELDAVRHALDEPIEAEASRRAAWVAELATHAGTAWSTPTFVSAASSAADVAFGLDGDHAIVVTGPVPAFEDHVLSFVTDAVDARLLVLEALVPAGHTGPGRTEHGNAVLSELTLETRARDSLADWRRVPLRWAWADHEQADGPFEATGVLTADARGWALDSHGSAPQRTLLVSSDEPFGAAGGTELRLTLSYRSAYEQHSLGRVRVRVSPLVAPELLPVALGTLLRATSVVGDTRPPLAELEPSDDRWRDVDGAGDAGSTHIGRRLWSPTRRDVELSSPDTNAAAVFVEGVALDRANAAAPGRVTLSLAPGPNRVVQRGASSAERLELAPPTNDDVLHGELVSWLLPQDAVSEQQVADAELAWRRQTFPAWRALDDRRVELETERAALNREIPRTMVMRELAEPRASFVLDRGRYDRPLVDRPVTPSVPSFLPPLPAGAPADRLGLAHWLTAPEHPLFARVAVNRLWQGLFGAGLVRTPGDFGFQGEWPTHPELLDWLAVEFRTSGWDVHALLRLVVTSRTYRQSSARTAEHRELDPANRLFGRYPRRRLGAEAIRDAALFHAGLLVERFGGPSVKPYQPAGLWREVAMPVSNTSTFVRGDGEDLVRRSLYTYWKRAVPPPALLTLDAPTRESCVVERGSTNTPLQALVLWNDEQFVEAARALATRVLTLDGDDDERLLQLARRVTGRRFEAAEHRRLALALDEFERSYAERPDDAAALIGVGASPAPTTIAPARLAAWTLIANAVLNLDETITQD
ncbi:MAG: PSD1 and planctomycete cytochrome C domain-containing protein [Planctomycetota bacterium]